MDSVANVLLYGALAALILVFGRLVITLCYLFAIARELERIKKRGV